MLIFKHYDWLLRMIQPIRVLKTSTAVIWEFFKGLGPNVGHQNSNHQVTSSHNDTARHFLVINATLTCHLNNWLWHSW